MKQKVLIVGAGEGGSALLNLLYSSNIFQIIGIIDINPLAKGLQIAKEYGIAMVAEGWKGEPVMEENDFYGRDIIDVNRIYEGNAY